MNDVRTIYMDHAATTPVSPRVAEAMQPYFAERFGNASSMYRLAQDARTAIDDARERCARVLGARGSEIVFTSGGTESDNAALLGVALARRGAGNHIVTTRIEHHAVLYAAELLEELGFDVTYVAPDRDGIVAPETIEEALRPETTLVSVMLANNEIGTIQPVAEIARRVRAHAAEAGRTVVVHTDAVQGPGALEVDVDALGVDLLSLSAHKFNGPKGVGLLYIRRGTPFRPTQVGGAQERDRRAGTENTPGIVGMAVALEAAEAARAETSAACAAMRDRLMAGIAERVEGARLNGHASRRLPSNVNFSFHGVEAEPRPMGLDLGGSAARAARPRPAASLEPSHVLLAIGASESMARSSLRLSVSADNTGEEVGYVIDTVAELVPKIRDMAGAGPH